MEEIRAYLGVDSLAYLTLENMLDCVRSQDDYCTACFTGEYRIPIDDTFEKNVFERNQLNLFDPRGRTQPAD